MLSLKLKNIKRFIAFRVLFNARFYYPVFTILFLDFGLTLEQFAVLNTVWAGTIVTLEVPTGALADYLGRSAMIKISSILMLLEILVLILIPVTSSNSFIFWSFFINRILSGAAEAFCSGADEALAYDTLKSNNLEKEWPLVLKRLMKIQSAGFIFALLIGSFAYDSNFINSAFGLKIAAETSMRFPLYLMLFSCVAVIYCAFSIEEYKATVKESFINTLKEGLNNIIQAASWIWNNPLALMLISAGMIFDCVIRLILTLNSEYYRIIDFPTWSFGIIGAALSSLGFLVPSVSSKLVILKSKFFNFSITFIVCLLATIGLSYCYPFWGILPVIAIFICMYNLNFILSHYLNEIALSELRATILSFKSLAFNLAYGLIGLTYASLSSQIRIADKNEVFVLSLNYIPKILIFLGALYFLAFRKRFINKKVSSPTF